MWVLYALQRTLYAESISYTNNIGGTGVTAHQLRLARASSGEVPVLSKGTRIVVLPPLDALVTRDLGSRVPFWLAELAEDEDAVLGVSSCLCACSHIGPTHTCSPCAHHLPLHIVLSVALATVLNMSLMYVDHHGLRVVPTAGEDEFRINWMGVFDGSGKITNSVTGIWRLRCAHSTARLRPHPWTEEKCSCEPHSKLADTIQRSSILLYESECTEQGRLDKVTKTQVEEMLRAHTEHHAKLPPSWIPKMVSLQDKKKGRGKSRRR